MPPRVLTSDRDAIRRLLTGDPLGQAARQRRRATADRRALGPAARARRAPRAAEAAAPAVPRRAGPGYAAADAAADGSRRSTAGARAQTVAVLPIAQNVTIEVILQAVLGVADEAMRGRLRRLIDNVLFYPFGAVAAAARPAASPPHRAAAAHPRAAAFAPSLPTPAVMTYFPGLKTRSRWNVATRRWWRHHDRLFALLDEQIAATRADPGWTSARTSWRCSSRRGTRTASALTDRGSARRSARAHRCRATRHGRRDRLGRRAARPRSRRRATRAARPRDEDDDEYLGRAGQGGAADPPADPGRARAGSSTSRSTIGRHAIPAGTLILIDAWGVHHDPAVYPDPERFRPERFLDDAPEPYAWLPFGGGAHRCIGSALAELEIKIALTTILGRVAISPADAELAPPARRAITMVPHAGGRISASPY